MNETQLVRWCVGYLTLQGHYVWRNNTGATKSEYTNKQGQRSTRIWRSGLRGSADILGVTKDGRFIAVECKIAPNKPTIHQEEFLLQVKQRGGVALIIYTPEELEKIKI